MTGLANRRHGPARRGTGILAIGLVLALGFGAAGCARDSDPVLIGDVVDDAADETAVVDDAADETAVVVDVAAEAASQAASTGTESGEALAEALSAMASSQPAFTVVAHAEVDRVVARTAPDDGAGATAELTNPTAVGGPLVFRVVAGSSDGNSEWIEVHLPVQPNGTTGWIRRAEVSLSNNPYRIEVDRDGFALRVYRQNVLWFEAPVAIGTGATPTPIGDFYLVELLAPPNPDGAYGPFAFGLSGFSEVLDSFGGADTAIIGLHGTNEPDSLGTNVSHGCVRIENTIIQRLADNVPLGTPVLIT